jgi:hypothetical protein
LVGAFRFALRFPILQQLWKTFDIIGGWNWKPFDILLKKLIWFFKISMIQLDRRWNTNKT